MPVIENDISPSIWNANTPRPISILLKNFLPILHQLVRYYAKPFHQRRLHNIRMPWLARRTPCPIPNSLFINRHLPCPMARKQAQLGHVPTYLPKDLALGHDPDTGISLIGKAQENSEEVAPLKAGYHEIQSKQASGILKKHKDVVILDIRTEKEYTASHIQKAKWLDYYQDDSACSPNSTGKSPTWSIVRQEVAAASRAAVQGPWLYPGLPHERWIQRLGKSQTANQRANPKRQIAWF